MDDRITLVDVGALGGLQPCWTSLAHLVRPVVFEPSPEGAEALKSVMGPDAIVISEALADSRGVRTLHIAQCPGCTSLLVPDSEVLAPYSVAPAFRIVRQIEVYCVRYDELHAIGKVPAPDAVKIDVQGFEYEILQGFGELLKSCLAVQVEAHLYPIYRRQHVLGDVVALLKSFGLVLRKMMPINHFDGDIVEVDAWFARNEPDEAGLTEAQRAKLGIINSAWDLPARPGRFAPNHWG